MGVILNKPAVLADDKVSWSEVKGMPAGFADGSDERGVRGMMIELASGPVSGVGAGAGGGGASTATCPANSYIVGGGGTGSDKAVPLSGSYLLDATRWTVIVHNTDSISHQFQALAMCLGATPSGALTPAK